MSEPETLRGICIELLNAIYFHTAPSNESSRKESDRSLKHHADKLRTFLNAPERKEVHYARVFEVTQGQHDALPRSLWQLGDCILVWVNEGDLFELGVHYASDQIHKGNPARTSSAPTPTLDDPHAFSDHVRIGNLEKRMCGVEDAVLQLQQKEIERGGKL